MRWRVAGRAVGHDDPPTSEPLDPPLVPLDGRARGRALMARLVGRERTDCAGPVELASRRPPLFR
jgi:hypothetical protein